jgi:Flp pilus assembly protein TadD
MIPFRVPRSARFALVVVAAATAGLAACATPPKSGDPTTTGSIPSTSPTDLQGTIAEWTERYRQKPDDVGVAMSFAAALRADGRTAQAVEVLQRAMLAANGDPVVASAYGKALAENGDFAQALKVIREANPPQTPDWRLTSAEGAIQDQLGNPAEARRLYGEALKMAPGEPSVLNNLGLSYLLTNELGKAEATLRQAVQSPRADGRIRQNLALAIGLSGRFEEARRVATAELPRDEAEANIAYLRSMLSQPDTWKQIRAADRKPKAG